MNRESNEKSIQPSALHPAWLEKIFSTMLAHYGSRFADMWRDADIAMVKAVWAEKLGGFTDKPECLKYGLDCLDGREWPPSLPEFLADCRRAPRPFVASIEHKLTPEEIDRNRERARKAIEELGRKLVA
jgi:hypothetical protein